MDLFHTSPTEITEIDDMGLFGTFLCFAAGRPYVMTAAATHYTYRLELDDDAVIGADRLFWHEDAAKLDDLVARLARRIGCTNDEAEALIEQRDNIFDRDCDLDGLDRAELAWEIQATAAEAAKILGYRGVVGDDEQGDCYLIDMLGREAELVRV